MQNVKHLNIKELQKISGGSSDTFWNHFGVGLGAAKNCVARGQGAGNPAVNCGAYGVVAGYRG